MFSPNNSLKGSLFAWIFPIP